MKRKKIIGIAASSFATMMIVSSLNLIAHADDTMTDVTSSLVTNNQQIYGTGQTASTNPLGTITYPTLTNITANYAPDGKITRRTTVIQTTYNGTFGIGSKYRLKSAQTAVFTTSTVQAASGSSLITSGTPSSISLTDVTTKHSLTSSINTQNWYLGIYSQITTRSSYDRVAVAKIPTPVQYPLKPTIDDDPIKDNATTITGKGTFAGDTISSDASDATTKVGSDLTYTLDVGSSLKGKSSVEVTETGTTNDEPGTASASIKPAVDLKISSTNPDIQLAPDDVTELDSKTDAEIVSWLVKAAGVTAIDQTTNTSDDITFTSDKSDLATIIDELADDDTVTVPIYAVKDGVKSDPVDVVISKTAGSVSFSTVSGTMAFKTIAVPTTETLVPTTSNWDVAIKDTRKVGSAWSVYATASKMTSSSHDLAGDVVYVDGSDKQVMTNSSVLIGSGSRQTGSNTETVTSDWSNTKGIFLEAQPSVYAGSYQGKVNWTLQDTAAK
ncbi:cell surface protein [Lactobacillus pentosus] [Lactiplantibacillus mudanjiangensis]|uniref:Cell surface protein [Lactobacillus pentosus] n=2 Tax=Lactiplantibacillus mudanjiangensis TaxID=1296538 RepID=A0A660DZA7_9LACO|nr:cell surface protein [Lactobacillus pentosus] [Lactiplantibacillus mudanjiangensis]VDG28689.1 cell surface protein [Lactobacillus pentosus] [Lactiplantibacillus mudanjiangensis]VDG33713.1 cell surface protein [Lactobacillus pentosus] [Lactiplantibacillus mudanjiangensis]